MKNGRTIPADEIFPGINRVIYNPPIGNNTSTQQESITVYGLDTEAYRNGRSFMFCTSEGDIWTPEDWPQCLFSRRWRQQKFVVWNLKYEQGALLQHLPREVLNELRTEGKVEHDGYKYRVIAQKFLSIGRKTHTTHIYDVAGFYGMSLDNAARKYLGEQKLDTDVTKYKPKWVAANWQHVADYCIQDARLTRDLARRLINTFEDFDVYPRKLYSTAYVSWQYFRKKCPYVHVKHLWEHKREILAAAMASYNGGKFEVTEKGVGEFWTYDIVSAYPHQIANLKDIRRSRINREPKFRAGAEYGFADVSMDIPLELPSPIIVKRGGVCTYPSGKVRRWITKAEVEWLRNNNVDHTIHHAFWLYPPGGKRPYRDRILELMEHKDRYKAEGDVFRYATVKIFLNSLYGKFVQLIEQNGKHRAGAAWNPIFAAHITASVRVRIAEMQRLYPSIVAVHTDSVISTLPLAIKQDPALGGWMPESDGFGVVLGCGVYQVGDKSKFRGFDSRVPLFELMPEEGPTLDIVKHKPRSWREVIHGGWDLDRINRFEDVARSLRVDFDSKRIWLKDWQDFGEVWERRVRSLPVVSLAEGRQPLAL